jgi:hypothetical protein
MQGAKMDIVFPVNPIGRYNVRLSSPGMSGLLGPVASVPSMFSADKMSTKTIAGVLSADWAVRVLSLPVRRIRICSSESPFPSSDKGDLMCQMPMKRSLHARRFGPHLLLACLLTVCGTGIGVGEEPRSTGYPTNGIDYPVRGRTERASSSAEDWENSNNDARQIGPGQTLTLGELDGPGRITHIWFTIAGSDRFYSRSTVLRVYWDGQDAPAIEAPLGDFFAVGHGMDRDVTSAMVANSSYGRAFNCYWPMPFRKSARVTMTNESTSDPIGLYWYIDWERRSVPEDAPYFHAKYRQENPPSPGSDYLIADIEGKGHYVGTVLSVRMSQPGWFGEGDDRFFIDGETKPSLSGTGTEDYFNDAWAFRELNRPYYGITIWEGMRTGARCTAYQWHVKNPVFFDKSLRVVIEHKGNTFYADNSLANAYSDRRPDFYSSVAFWYQLGTTKQFGQWPRAEERVPQYTLVQLDETLAENLPPNVTLMNERQFTNGKGLAFDPGNEAVRASLDLSFEVAREENYVVFLRVWPRGDAGIYDFALDGELCIKDRDLCVEHSRPIDLQLGHLQHLQPGTHYIQAVCKGKNVTSFNNALFVDAVVLEPAGEFEPSHRD